MNRSVWIGLLFIVDLIGSWALLLYGFHLCVSQHPVAGGWAIALAIVSGTDSDRVRVKMVKADLGDLQ